MAWSARNIGLTGDGLTVNYIIQNPATRHLDSTSHDLWIATDGGIYHSTDGGREWAKIILPAPNNDQFVLTPAPTYNDLIFTWIDYDPINDQTLYTLGAKIASNKTWIYKTTDSGLTWVSKGNFWGAT